MDSPLPPARYALGVMPILRAAPSYSRLVEPVFFACGSIDPESRPSFGVVAEHLARARAVGEPGAVLVEVPRPLVLEHVVRPVLEDAVRMAAGGPPRVVADLVVTDRGVRRQATTVEPVLPGGVVRARRPLQRRHPLGVRPDRTEDAGPLAVLAPPALDHVTGHQDVGGPLARHLVEDQAELLLVGRRGAHRVTLGPRRALRRGEVGDVLVEEVRHRHERVVRLPGRRSRGYGARPHQRQRQDRDPERDDLPHPHDVLPRAR